MAREPFPHADVAPAAIADTARTPSSPAARARTLQVVTYERT
jgi:hypothetical protein